MRKVAVFISMLVVLIFVGGLVYGSGIDNKTNWSAGYIRTLNRNAVYDSPDAVVYNPAGVIKLGSGFHLGAHNQFLLPDYSHVSSLSTITYAASNPTLILPSAYAVYNREKLGVFGGFYVPGGGGKLEYDDGIFDINEVVPDPTASATLKSIYYGGSLGAVYAITDMFSLAASARIVYAVQNFESSGAGGLLIDLEENSTGFGGTFGLNIAIPVMEANIGVRYETKVKLNWEVQKADGPLAALQGISVGDTRDRDLPAMLAIGASVKPLPMLRTEASFNYYFNTGADWDGEQDKVSNGWEIGAMAELSMIPGLVGSVGVLYADPGADQDSYIYLSPALKSLSVAGGISIRMIPNLNVELGVLKPFYTGDDGFSQPPASVAVTVDKSLWIIAVGASYTIGI